MLLIGSKAIKHHFPDFHREPKDNDWGCCQEVRPVDKVVTFYEPFNR
jgi:hypothetical protein